MYFFLKFLARLLLRKNCALYSASIDSRKCMLVWLPLVFLAVQVYVGICICGQKVDVTVCGLMLFFSLQILGELKFEI